MPRKLRTFGRIINRNQNTRKTKIHYLFFLYIFLSNQIKRLRRRHEQIKKTATSRKTRSQFFTFFFLHLLSNQTKFSEKRPMTTKIINWDSSITEPSSWAVRVEVSTVREPVSTCKRAEEIVGATVDGGVSNDK